MIRLLFLIHRYLGIALGMVITIWCLSGFVMMYVQYPDLTAEERLAGLQPLALEGCCQVPDDFSDITLDRFRIEMLEGRRHHAGAELGPQTVDRVLRQMDQQEISSAVWHLRLLLKMIA